MQDPISASAPARLAGLRRIVPPPGGAFLACTDMAI